MKVIEYIGKTATVRIIEKQDFVNYGINDQGRVVFDVVDISTRGQAQVSDGAAEMLLGLEPGNFREVPEDGLALNFRQNGASGTDRKDIESE